MDRLRKAGEVVPTKGKKEKVSGSDKLTPAASLVRKIDMTNYKVGVIEEKSEVQEEISNPIGRFAESIQPGMIKILQCDMLKFQELNLPYTIIGRANQSLYFVKECVKDKFTEKKIDHISENVVSGLSKVLTGIEKKKDPKALTRSVKKPIGSNHVLNFMTMTYIEENKAFLAGGIDQSLCKVSSKAYFFLYQNGLLEEVPSMNQPRYSHGALLMAPNGVMIAGGRTYGQEPECILDSSEYFDFNKHQWRQLPPMNKARCQFEFCLYQSKAYVFGGLTDEGISTDSIEYFDNDRYCWIEFRYRLPYMMDSFRVIPTDDNHRILLVGGRQNHENSGRVVDFSLEDGSFLYHSRMVVPRINPKVLQVGGEYILLGGGIPREFAEKYDRREQKWVKEQRYSELASLFDTLGRIEYATMLTASVLIKPLTIIESEDYEDVDLTLIDTNSLSPEEINKLMEKKRKAEMMKEKERKKKENPEQFEKEEEQHKKASANNVIKSVDGKLFVFGNYLMPMTAYIDVDKRQAQVIRVPNHFRPFDHTKVHRLSDGKCLLFNIHPDNLQEKSSPIHFDPFSWTFTRLPDRIKRVHGSSIVQLEPDCMYFVGGLRNSSSLLASNHLEVFSFKTNKWRLLASMKKTRQKFTCFAWNKWIYAVGGINNDSQVEDSIERYCPIQNEWEILAMKFTTRICQGLAIPRMKDILVLGGFNKTAMLDTVYTLTFLEELPPNCAFLKNDPLLKLMYQPEYIDLGSLQVVSYMEVDLHSVPVKRILRKIDTQTCEIGAELEIDVAAQLAGLKIAGESFG